jgi:hypothetical protein
MCGLDGGALFGARESEAFGFDGGADGWIANNDFSGREFSRVSAGD